MFARRCEECGEVRWTIFGRDESEPAECPACGATMTVERRHPGRAAAPAEPAERRHFEPPVTTP